MNPSAPPGDDREAQDKAPLGLRLTILFTEGFVWVLALPLAGAGMGFLNKLLDLKLKPGEPLGRIWICLVWFLVFECLLMLFAGSRWLSAYLKSLRHVLDPTVTRHLPPSPLTMIGEPLLVSLAVLGGLAPAIAMLAGVRDGFTMLNLVWVGLWLLAGVAALFLMRLLPKRPEDSQDGDDHG